MNEIRGSTVKLIVEGDCRADSPGHSAKFGTYSLLDVTRTKIINTELVKVGHGVYTYVIHSFIEKSNEVKESYHMEKEGLELSVNCLEKQNVKISKIIMDRHRSIAKWLREKMKETVHCYDVYGKGYYSDYGNTLTLYVDIELRKKLENLAKEKEC